MMPRAKPMAPAAAFIFDFDRRVISALMFAFGTVCRLSKLAAQVSGRPSSFVSTTSVGMLRMVDVMGATVTLLSTPIAESRVKISTGRLLLGAGNAYQQTSPRLTTRPSLAGRSTHRIRPARPAVWRNHRNGVLPDH